MLRSPLANSTIDVIFTQSFVCATCARKILKMMTHARIPSWLPLAPGLVFNDPDFDKSGNLARNKIEIKHTAAVCSYDFGTDSMTIGMTPLPIRMYEHTVERVSLVIAVFKEAGWVITESEGWECQLEEHIKTGK